MQVFESIHELQPVIGQLVDVVETQETKLPLVVIVNPVIQDMHVNILLEIEPYPQLLEITGTIVHILLDARK